MKNKRKSTGEKTRKKKRGMLIALFVSINVYLIFSFLLGEMGLLNAIKLRKTREAMHNEVAALDAENKRLLDQIDALRNDAETIEGLARGELGLVKEGELVYEFFKADAL